MTCPALAALVVGLICTATVDRVIDGDTFMARFGDVPHAVRVVGIDTPERGEPGHEFATRAAQSQFEGEFLTLTIGGAASRTKRGRCVGEAVLDLYGRVLARVAGWPETVAEFDKGAWCYE